MLRLRFLLALTAAAVTAASCSSSSKTTTPTSVGNAGASTSTSSSVPSGSGPVKVLYAGSLVNLMDKQVGPAFHTATGYTFQGFSAGSDALATQIKGKVRQGDVFVSASPAVNAELEGAANGNWVNWYASFASSPLVLGYSKSSRFAADLQSKPWYQVLTEPGILIGRTDPTTDPKGKLTVEALQQAATADNQPALNSIVSSTSTVFPEETLVGRLQAAQLDVGFFYSSEAKAAGIPTVPLTGVSLKATYTITVLAGAPNEAGAEAFVAFLLGKQGQAFLTQDGFDVTEPPTVTGTGVPSSLSSVLGSSSGGSSSGGSSSS